MFAIVGSIILRFYCTTKLKAATIVNVQGPKTTTHTTWENEILAEYLKTSFLAR